MLSDSLTPSPAQIRNPVMCAALLFGTGISGVTQITCLMGQVILKFDSSLKERCSQTIEIMKDTPWHESLCGLDPGSGKCRGNFCTSWGVFHWLRQGLVESGRKRGCTGVGRRERVATWQMWPNWKCWSDKECQARGWTAVLADCEWTATFCPQYCLGLKINYPNQALPLHIRAGKTLWQTGQIECLEPLTMSNRADVDRV